MKLIVGLGNPGKQYERTRHNVGFLVIDELRNEEQAFVPSSSRGGTKNKGIEAEVFKITLEGKRVMLTKPTTFMNNSGQPVQALMHFYKLTPANLIVIHDDKDILLGETRVQRDRGAAGHNGVLSIIEHLGTKDFVRIRVGVAPNPLLSEAGPRIADTADFVLGKFTKEEQKILKGVIENVVEEVKRLILPS